MIDRPPGTGSDPGGEVSLITPPGRGGVAVLWVRQPGGGWIQSHFRPRGRSEPTPDRVRTGWIVSGDETLDEVLVRVRGPGEAEIHCHGGKAVAERILGLAEQAGMERVPGRQAARRLHRGDPIGGAALALLIEAETDGAARMLADQAAGLLSRRLDEILTLGLAEAAEAIDRLIETAAFGVAATSENETWIVGPPNAGKSTLLNALVGWDRAIVHSGPGTTRDLVREKTSFGGIPVVLVDTPGVRRAAGVEAEGVARVDTGWREGCRAILCIDGSRPYRDDGLLARLDRSRDIVVLSKSDLPAAFPPEVVRGWGDTIRVSAITGEGMGHLRESVLRRLAPGGAPAPGSPVVFTRGQEEALRRARREIAKGDLDQAARWVRQCRCGEENGVGDD